MNIKKLLPTLTAAIILTVMPPLSAFAGAPYDVYNYDRWGEAIPSQAGYVADRAVSGYDLGIEPFASPSDFFCDSGGTFYIADSGNDRIVKLNAELSEAVEIYDKFTMPDGSVTELKNPNGVYVSDNLIYIADTDNSRILVCSSDGAVITEITKPDSELYDANKTFLPQRVIADKAGNVYAVLGNITTGAAMFDRQGEFIGFYGANRVEPTAEIAANYIKGLFMSDEKKARRTRNVPSAITSFDIDGDFIFTCSSSSTQTTDTVKKLDAAGRNIFADSEMNFGDYTPIYDSTLNKYFEPAIIDIDVSADGSINCLDYTTGRIFQYDEECNLLFIMGALADQLGGFKKPAAVESFDNKLYVLDSAKNTITVFRETDFGRAVHKATVLYNDGYYEEALEPWYEVLEMDGNYRRAFIGAASALFSIGDYKGAMKYARLADASKIYNKAFEGWREEFIKSHFTEIAAVVVLAVMIAVFVGKRLKSTSEKRHLNESGEKQL